MQSMKSIFVLLILLLSTLLFTSCGWEEPVPESEQLPITFTLSYDSSNKEKVQPGENFLAVSDTFELYANSASLKFIEDYTVTLLNAEGADVSGELEEIVSAADAVTLEAKVGRYLIKTAGVYSLAVVVNPSTMAYKSTRVSVSLNMGNKPHLDSLSSLNSEITVKTRAKLSIPMALAAEFVVVEGQAITYEWYKGAELQVGKSLANFDIITAVDSDAGVYKLVASNKWGSAVSGLKTVNVVTNIAPVWKDTTVIPTIAEGAALSFNAVDQVIDEDGPTLTLTVASMTKDGVPVTPVSAVVTTEGLLTMVTDFNSEGKYEITLGATDGIIVAPNTVVVPVQKTFTLDVIHVNQAPIWKDLAVIPGITEGTPLAFDAAGQVEDLDGETPVLSLISVTKDGVPVSPVILASIVLTAEGALTMPTDFNSAGSYIFTLGATDGIIAAPVQKEFSLVVSNTNQVPTWDSETLVIPSVEEDVAVDYDLSDKVVDLDPGETLTFTLVSSSLTGVKVDGSKVLVDAAISKKGSYTISVAVSDGKVSVTVTISIVISEVGAVNQAPVWNLENNALALSAIAEGGVIDFVYTNLVEDLDGPAALTFTAVDTPAGLTITDGKIAYKAPVGSQADYSFKIIASDGALTSEATFSFTVTNGNLPPYWEAASNTPIEVTETVPATVTLNEFGKDNDDAVLTYALVAGGWSGATYADGIITLSPTLDDQGTKEFTVTVTDGKSPAVAQKFTVSVLNKNQLPVWTEAAKAAITVAEGASLSVDLSTLAGDNDGESLVFTPVADAFQIWATITDGKTLTLSPIQGTKGTHTLSVTASDSVGGVVQVLTVNVTDVNVKPVITGQTVITMDEDAALPITPEMLTVTDADGETVFTLEVKDGTDFTHVGNTITPAANFNGALVVPATVKDAAGAESDLFNLQVTVNPVNDVPVISAQSAIVGVEDTPLTLNTGMFTIVDPDASDEFVLTVEAGDNYTVVGNVITPAANFNGELTVPVSVKDKAEAASNTFSAKVTVSAATDAPVITGPGTQLLEVDEDGELLLTADAVTVVYSDGDATTQFTYELVADDNCTVTSMSVKPKTDYNGPLTVAVTATAVGSTVKSQPYSLNIKVNAVNDAPAITANNPLAVTEDTPVEVKVDLFTVTDVDEETVFTLELLANDNYTVAGNVLTPAANFDGELTIKVKAKDAALAESAVYEFKTTVTPVADAAKITAKAGIETDEDVALKITAEMFTVVDGEPGSVYTVNLKDGADYTVVGGTVKPDLNFNGDLSVPVSLTANGVTSNEVNLTVKVNAVNDAPVFALKDAITMSEDVAKPLTIDMFTATDVDNPLSELTLVLEAGDHYTISGTTITLEANYNGTITVPVYVTDKDKLPSNKENLVISIGAVADKPVISAPGTSQILELDEDGEIVLLANLINASDNDGNTKFELTVAAGDNYTVTGTTVKPLADFNGTLSVPVTVKAEGGTLSSDPYTLSVKVNSVNDAPVISGQETVTIEEGKPFTLTLSHLKYTDNDIYYGDTHTLTVRAGTDFTYTGNTITVSKEGVTAISIPVEIKDAAGITAYYTVNATVKAVNDVPVIKGVGAIDLYEDNILDMTQLFINIDDPDNSNHTIIMVSGDQNCTVNNTNKTVVPKSDYHGPINFVIKVSDGVSTSAAYTITATVKSVEDKPVARIDVPAGGDYIFFGGTFQLPVTVIDPEGVQSVTVTDGYGGAVIYSSNSVITSATTIPWKPAYNEDVIGKHTVVVKVVDLSDNETSTSLALYVRGTLESDTIAVQKIIDLSGLMVGGIGDPGGPATVAAIIKKANNRVETLMIGRDGYGGIDTISSDLGNLSALKNLEIDQHRIRRLPDEFDRLTEIDSLYIGGCPNLDRLPFSIRKLTNLRTFTMHSTGVSSLPDGFRSFSKLEYVKLVSSQLTSLPFKAGDLPLITSSDNFWVQDNKLPNESSSDWAKWLDIIYPHHDAWALAQRN